MGTPADKAKGGTVQGEGDYEAGRRFDKAEGEFVKSGKAKAPCGQGTAGRRRGGIGDGPCRRNRPLALER